MTEERANAGTPGPIDPTNTEQLLMVHNDAMVKHDRYIADVVNSWEGNVSQETIDDMLNDRPHNAILAVARAVCPAHHAVFDTRTHVAVPVAEIREAAESLQKVANGSISGNNHSHRPWAQKRADAIRSLLPTESEATR